MGDFKENGLENKVILIIKGIGIAMILTIIMILVLSIILAFTSLKENTIMPSIIFISSFDILIGSFWCSKKIENKGIIFGSIVGLGYMIFIYLISSILNFDFSLGLNSIIMIGCGILGGALGGILGINMK